MFAPTLLQVVEVVVRQPRGKNNSPRGYFSFSTWARNNSSEVSFDSSEVLFLAHVEIFYFPRGDLRIATWGTASSDAKAYRFTRDFIYEYQQKLSSPRRKQILCYRCSPAVTHPCGDPFIDGLYSAVLSFSGSFRRLIMRLLDRAVWFELYTDAFFLLQIQIFVLPLQCTT